MANRIILASASLSRGQMLRDAGLDIDCIASDLDEDIIKAKGLSVVETALELAKAKALCVAKNYPDSLVIGADQMMECEEVRFDKPCDREQARTQLMQLRSKIHCLHSAVAIVSNQECLWSHVEKAELEMRNFSDAFLDEYLDNIGDDVLTTVGGYRLESKGIQLFSQIKGDYFTILGLPLLAVLSFLRSKDIISV